MLLLAVETAAMVALVVFLVYADVTGGATSRGGAVMLTVFTALVAALIGWLAWALWRRRRWARGPAIVLQLLLLPSGYSMAVSGAAWLGLPLMAIGLCGVAALVAPGTREALGVR